MANKIDRFGFTERIDSSASLIAAPDSLKRKRILPWGAPDRRHRAGMSAEASRRRSARVRNRSRGRPSDLQRGTAAFLSCQRDEENKWTRDRTSWVLPSGTEGSNPLPSSGESIANLNCQRRDRLRAYRGGFADSPMKGFEPSVFLRRKLPMACHIRKKAFVVRDAYVRSVLSRPSHKPSPMSP